MRASIFEKTSSGTATFAINDEDERVYDTVVMSLAQLA
jgi:hypothetical protein